MRHASRSTARMEIDGKSIPLGPGMAVTVGIKTSTRRTISYLIATSRLSPGEFCERDESCQIKTPKWASIP
jgi:hypothetical protein